VIEPDEQELLDFRVAIRSRRDVVRMSCVVAMGLRHEAPRV
jgi:hypothetical protein